MRIVYLSNSIIPSRTANSLHVMKMCQAYADEGHEVTLLAPMRPGREPGVADVFRFYGVRKSFTIRRYLHPSIPSGSRIAAAHVRKIIGRPDLVYTRALTLGHLAGVGRQTPAILEMHMPVGEEDRQAFEEIRSRTHFDRLVVITRALAGWYAGEYPDLRNRIQVVPDAADPPLPGIRPAHVRRDHRLQAGYCGHLYSGKGAEIIVGLARLMDDVVFHVVGGTEAEIARWRRVATGLDNIVFHGYFPHAQALRYVCAFDIALAPYQRVVSVSGSRNDDAAPWMSPLKVFEYMALGKAIVASDLPVLREVLVDGENALLCPPEDLASWCRALRRFASPELRQKLGAQAAQNFEARYTWRQRVRRIAAPQGSTGNFCEYR